MKQSQVEEITLYPKVPTTGQRVVLQLIFWGLLVGVIGITRDWFGGAWVIDIVAVIMTVATVINIARHWAGKAVTMTKEELKAWVTAGMPSNAQRWLELHRSYND